MSPVASISNRLVAHGIGSQLTAKPLAGERERVRAFAASFNQVDRMTHSWQSDWQTLWRTRKVLELHQP